jgi:hypothetical protein
MFRVDRRIPAKASGQLLQTVSIYVCMMSRPSCIVCMHAQSAHNQHTMITASAVIIVSRIPDRIFDPHAVGLPSCLVGFQVGSPLQRSLVPVPRLPHSVRPCSTNVNTYTNNRPYTSQFSLCIIPKCSVCITHERVHMTGS